MIKSLNIIALGFWTLFTLCGLILTSPIILILFFFNKKIIKNSFSKLTTFWFLKSNYIFDVQQINLLLKNTLFVSANNHFAIHMFYYAILPSNTYFFMGFNIKNKTLDKILKFFRIISISPSNYQQLISKSHNLNPEYNYFILAHNKIMPSPLIAKASTTAAYFALKNKMTIIPTTVLNPTIYREHFSFWKSKKIIIKYGEQISIKNMENTQKNRKKITAKIQKVIKALYQEDKPPSTTIS